jgi:DNA-binding transcriptional ArsR family regulator
MMEIQPKIIWDKGSAYDLFVSLYIIHRPDEFGLRPSWAAGVRSRLPISLRDALEHSQEFMGVPLPWIYQLPEPKDSKTAVASLAKLAPEDRLPALVFGNRHSRNSKEYRDCLLSMDGKQRLTANLETQIKDTLSNPSIYTKAFGRAVFDAWSDRKSFGEKFLEALEAYVNNFFLEEEPRIIPAQDEGLDKAQSMAEQKDALTLLEELSEGVRMDWISEVTDLVLAPSFWGAPFVFFNRIDDYKGIILFGARPEGKTLVPGELVPEELLNALKALADPTRLRILHYLQEGPSTTTELAKILRLRPPTVIHHLQSLRLAGLIFVTVSPKSERRYAVRMEGLDNTTNYLKDYLTGG